MFQQNLLLELGVNYLLFCTYWSNDQDEIGAVYGINKQNDQLTISTINCTDRGREIISSLWTSKEAGALSAIDLRTNQWYELDSYEHYEPEDKNDDYTDFDPDSALELLIEQLAEETNDENELDN